jgi:hypothetical protein
MTCEMEQVEPEAILVLIPVIPPPEPPPWWTLQLPPPPVVTMVRELTESLSFHGEGTIQMSVAPPPLPPFGELRVAW